MSPQSDGIELAEVCDRNLKSEQTIEKSGCFRYDDAKFPTIIYDQYM